MNTLATALKSEIVQATQRTLRDEAQALRKAATACAREIQALERRVASLEQGMARLSGASTRSRAEGTNGQSPGKSGLDGATGGRSRTLAHRPSGRGGRPHRATGSARAPGLASGASAHPGDAEAIEPDGSDAAGSSALRFSAKGFTKLRQRLGLSAAALGALLGVTAQSVYKWEDGKAHPRAAQLRAIAAIRKMGKREAAARLAEMNGHEEPAAASGAQVAQAAGA